MLGFLLQWLLYRYSCIDDSSFEKFLPRVWCLLRRYQVLSHRSCISESLTNSEKLCLCSEIGPQLQEPDAKEGLNWVCGLLPAFGDRTVVRGAVVILTGDLSGSRDNYL